ncbi:LYR motif-containing protein 5B [Hoplias malabaricus]|uniref:LYR motif-containing protein 5B n=1 Tax=Hoplias malabaricus TaxID=27720 RepID=UPI0034622CBF
MANPLRAEVVRLYKTLLFLGQEYPKGADYFRDRLRAAFTKNRDVKEPVEIRRLLDRGEYVVKELEALYYLRKYRAMKKHYYES